MKLHLNDRAHLLDCPTPTITSTKVYYDLHYYGTALPITHDTKEGRKIFFFLLFPTSFLL